METDTKLEFVLTKQHKCGHCDEWFLCHLNLDDDAKWCECWQAIIHLRDYPDDVGYLEYYCSAECYDAEFPEPTSSDTEIPALVRGDDTEEEEMPIIHDDTDKKGN